MQISTVPQHNWYIKPFLSYLFKNITFPSPSDIPREIMNVIQMYESTIEISIGMTRC